MALLAALIATVSACSTVDPAPPPTVRTVIERPPLPPAALVPCRKRALPDRDLSQGEVTQYWGADRATIDACETRRAAVVEALKDRK